MWLVFSIYIFLMRLKQSFTQTLEWLKQNIPLILGVLFLVSMIQNTKFVNILKSLWNDFFSVVFADFIGSIMAWNPINSYIIAWEFWDVDSKILVITVFLISWITVGFLQIPAESFFLWKKFALVRNIFAFCFAILIAYSIYFFYSFL